MALFSKIVSAVTPKSQEEKWDEAYRHIIRQEAKIGGKVFGPIPAGVRREFFCLDEHTWVWHEEWNDQSGAHHIRTTRYDVRPHGIFKAQNGQPYQPLSEPEVRTLYAAAKRYRELVQAEFGRMAAA